MTDDFQRLRTATQPTSLAELDVILAKNYAGHRKDNVSDDDLSLLDHARDLAFELPADPAVLVDRP